MHKKKKTMKSHARHHRAATKPVGMQNTRVIPQSRVAREEESETFTPMETGQPDQDPMPDVRNPAAAQGGRGPLNQEGEGNRQNDELAELESIEPGDELK